MTIKQFAYYLLLSIIVFGCFSQKEIKKNLEDVNPYKECSTPIAFYDVKDYDYGLKNLDDISYSTTNTLIYGFKGISTDTLEKDSIRLNISKRSKSQIKSIFPNIKILNDNTLYDISPSKFHKAMHLITSNKNINRNSKRRAIKKLSVPDNRKKQMLIFINSLFSSKTYRNQLSILIFDVYTNEPLYLDQIEYYCDIRDYKALEKVISYGLLKLKENFE